MAWAPGNIKCVKCGCLKFDPEHEECETCRSQIPTSRSTARRMASSNGHGTSSPSNASSSNGANGRRRGDGERRQQQSSGKKRRIEETGGSHSSSKQKPPRPGTKKQPVVIDLLSSSDDEEGEKIAKKTKKAKRKEIRRQEKIAVEMREQDREQKQKQELLQSRVFPYVHFVESDFPSMEEAVFMRKHAAEPGKSPAKAPPPPPPPQTATAPPRPVPISAPSPPPPPAVSTRPLQSQNAPVSVSKETPKNPMQAVEKAQTPAKRSAPPPAQDVRLPTVQAARTPLAQTTQASTAPSGTKVPPKDTVQAGKATPNDVDVELNSAEPVQSRIFDSIDFEETDFVTVYDGLAVARRSHPPTLKTATPAGPSSSTTSASVSSATPPTATVPRLNGATDAMATDSASSKRTSPASNTISKSASETDASVTPAAPTSQPAAPTARTTTSAAPAGSPVAPTGPKVSSASTKPLAARPTVAVMPTPSATATSSSALPTPALEKITSASREAVTGSVSTLPTPTSSTTVSAPVATTAIPATSVGVTSGSTTKGSAMSSVSPTVSVPTFVREPTKTLVPPASMAHPERTVQVTKAANTLFPKKKHPEGPPRPDKQPPRSESAPTGANGAAVPAVGPAVVPAPDQVEVVEEFVVERPLLGNCSPEFLAFMRECCGDDDVDNDDSEEVTLLDVIDLTNLSDSEDSDSESPQTTPRVNTSDAARQHNLSANGVFAPGVIGPSGSGTWYVPTLNAERKRRLEKVECALCEESGTARSLIRCPTCTKYYHKKCALENGDDTICWNCELGSMIDDSELDQEHAKYESEYLEYLRQLRDRQHSQPPGHDEDVIKEERGVVGDGDVEMTSATVGEGQRWKSFIGEATADIDASYHETTNRIAAELRNEELRSIYSRGFVTREEFDAQMSEVEKFYIDEEARLQRSAEAKKAQAAASSVVNGEQSANTIPDDGVSVANSPVVATAVNSTGKVQLASSSTGNNTVQPVVATALSSTGNIAQPAISSSVATNPHPVAATVAQHAAVTAPSLAPLSRTAGAIENSAASNVPPVPIAGPPRAVQP